MHPFPNTNIWIDCRRIQGPTILLVLYFRRRVPCFCGKNCYLTQISACISLTFDPMYVLVTSSPYLHFCTSVSYLKITLVSCILSIPMLVISLIVCIFFPSTHHFWEKILKPIQLYNHFHLLVLSNILSVLSKLGSLPSSMLSWWS